MDRSKAKQSFQMMGSFLLLWDHVRTLNTLKALFYSWSQQPIGMPHEIDWPPFSNSPDPSVNPPYVYHGEHLLLQGLLLSHQFVYESTVLG